jgi:hypothetical protein
MASEQVGGSRWCPECGTVIEGGELCTHMLNRKPEINWQQRAEAAERDRDVLVAAIIEMNYHGVRPSLFERVKHLLDAKEST